MKPLLVVAVFVSAAAAQVIPVNGGGVALLQAVASAPNGAVLVVAPGTYYPFTATQRQLTLVAPQRATIGYSPLSSGPTIVTATGMSAAQPFCMIGFDVVQGSLLTAPGYVHGIIDGRDLHLQGCTCQRINAANGMLLLADCTVTAAMSSAVVLQTCSATMTDSSFVGGNYQAPWGPAGGAPVINALGSNLRLERIHAQATTSALQPGSALALTGLGGVHCTATVADSVLIPGPSIPMVSVGFSIACDANSTVTVSGSQTPGGVTCTYATTPLATLRWLTRQWIPGGTSVLRETYQPATIAIGVLSLSAVPFSLPDIAELSFVGLMPDYIVDTYGLTDAAGNFDWTVSVPPTPSLQYASAWLHGVAMPGLPLHVSTPLGGPLR